MTQPALELRPADDPNRPELISDVAARQVTTLRVTTSTNGQSLMIELRFADAMTAVFQVNAVTGSDGKPGLEFGATELPDPCG